MKQLLSSVVLALVMSGVPLCGYAIPVEYDVNMQGTNGVTYDYSFVIDFAQDGKRVRQDGYVEYWSGGGSIEYVYARLTRDGSQMITVEDWAPTSEAGSFDYFYASYNGSFVEVEVMQNWGPGIGVGPTFRFDGVTEFNNTWHEQATRLRLFDRDRAEWNFSEGGNFTLTRSTVPEPNTMLLFGAGLAGIAGWRRRINKSS